MSDTHQTLERSDVMLDELARMGLTLARELHQRATQTEDNEAAVRLALAFHHVSRSVRQSVALSARLQRERRRDAELRLDTAERRATAQLQDRTGRVRAAIEQLSWTETADWRTLTRREKLELLLNAEAASDDFLDGPVEAPVARIARAMGLTLRAVPSATDAPAPEAPPGAEPAEPRRNPSPPS
jgi:hypothetical protein